MTTETALTAQAMAALAGHGALGRRARAMVPTCLSCRSLPEGLRLVLLFSPGKSAEAAQENLVYKYKSAPTDPARFQAEIAAHRRAFQVMGAARVPELLSVDEKAQSLLLRHVPGQTVQDALELADLGLADAEDAMRRAGAWIGAFHRATRRETRRIQPDAMRRWAEEMTEQVRRRQTDVPRRDLFLKYAAEIPAFCEAARGAETPISESHGDFHLRNLILARDSVYGVDFCETSLRPPAHDLSMFVLRYRVRFGGPAEAAPLRAFWEGYGGQEEVAAAFRYLLPIQLLSDWRRIPKKRDARSAGQQRQLRGLLRLAEEVFSGSTAL